MHLQGGLRVRIKWPNDIYHAGLKIGGALIHTTWAAGSFSVLTGIGLNLSNSAPTTCLNDALAVALAADSAAAADGSGGVGGGGVSGAAGSARPQHVKAEVLLAAVLGHLESCFDVFQAHGFDPLLTDYLDAWMHSNQVVMLDSGIPGAAKTPLTISGLSPHGFLLALDDLGQRYELTPDGNSLDMMQGLLKRKL